MYNDGQVTLATRKACVKKLAAETQWRSTMKTKSILTIVKIEQMNERMNVCRQCFSQCWRMIS